MLTRLRIQGFKSWADTGDINLGRLTGFFGTNSSGKTSLLQFLLMLKQTVESTDRSRVLHTGDANSYVDLGTFYDIIHKHDKENILRFRLEWSTMRYGIPVAGLALSASVRSFKNHVELLEFSLEDKSNKTKVKRNENRVSIHESGYRPIESNEGPETEFFNETKDYLSSDVEFIHFYNIRLAFPHYLENDLTEVVFDLESQAYFIHYIGPLRESPGRLYSWSGESPSGVGSRGERTIEALLASETRTEELLKNPETGKAHTLTQHIAYWLKRLGLIHSFKLKPIARNRNEYEVRIKQSPNATDVALTDVGFGVSQVLPVLTLCFYAPKRSTILFEQPEIHLHPAVQSGLADVFLDAIKQRGVQIILESHSEHLLHRLQRRIAEEEVSAEDVRLYFAQANDGESKLTPLDLDDYGNIRNWPKGFFGDEIGDLMLMTQAAMKRKIAERDQQK